MIYPISLKRSPVKIAIGPLDKAALTVKPIFEVLEKILVIFGISDEVVPTLLEQSFEQAKWGINKLSKERVTQASICFWIIRKSIRANFIAIVIEKIWEIRKAGYACRS